MWKIFFFLLAILFLTTRKSLLSSFLFTIKHPVRPSSTLSFTHSLLILSRSLSRPPFHSLHLPHSKVSPTTRETPHPLLTPPLPVDSNRHFDLEGSSAHPSRKKSLVRPERARLDPNHHSYHYTQKAAEQANHLNILPSSTGNDPNQPHMIPLNDIPPSQSYENLNRAPAGRIQEEDEEDDYEILDIYHSSGSDPRRNEFAHEQQHFHGGSQNNLMRQDSLEDNDNNIHAITSSHSRNYYDNLPEGAQVVEGLNDETPTARRIHSNDSSVPSDNRDLDHPYGMPEHDGNNNPGQPLNEEKPKSRRLRRKQEKDKKNQQPGPPPSIWRLYCSIITFWAPPFAMRWFGMTTKERQMAWREKVGLVTVILYIAAFVAYLTFGFTQTVCKNDLVRIRINEVNAGNLIIHGRAYDLTRSKHPAARGVPASSNILYPPVNAGGMDASFLFQNVNGHCKDLLVPRENSTIPTNGNELAWYMPCRVFAQDGSTQANFTTDYYNGYACHTSSVARKAYWSLKVSGEVYFSWEDVRNRTRNLIVFNGNVIDLGLISWIQSDDIEVPDRFYELQKDESIRGLDVSTVMASGFDRQVLRCLSDIAKVGYVDSDQIGCIASKVVLYVSLVFIISIVAVKFVFALYFRWVISGKQGADYMTNKELNKRENIVEDWSDNLYAQGPVKTVKKPPFANHTHNRSSTFGSRSRLSQYGNITMGSQIPSSSTSKITGNSSVYLENSGSRNSFGGLDDPFRSSSVLDGSQSIISADTSYRGITNEGDDEVIDVNSPDYVVPQPPIDFQPFGFPLAHTMCLVTAYSESIDGLRTTLDSIATTDYPNSHKMILVICDGLIKGAGNDMTTPDICLSMMKDFTEQPDEVQPYSYVSVVSGSKRHNMAKVYSGFYKYDSNTIDHSKQQRIPMITVVKCGTPAEQGLAKPGNRGKRDSQIILMSFLQRVMFDERMTELDYELFNGIWKVTGIAPDFYEIVLMVDADTKVFPDSLTHMVASMVKDPEIMGLCGETKISNKRDSWVSMIQVFEYYISHHQAKAFESVFGGVTCLPGCFCMYRIKAPKGDEGYWVPILCNPDIVERYAENVVDTLHKKNLLLLGEDRYLSSLMLRTFPKRKQIFVPKAVCKTVVPDKFSVLLSQRRRWINSTVHNLMELVLVRDLCGVFCISMQFVVFIELVGTLILPAAISFTIYVIIIAIVKKPTPVLSLILLALILGLPGVLIVVTASRWSYILWMLIYLLSLPIWNFVLPAYAYWKFDDFSWGDTRAISGGDKGGHDEASGEFDSSQIIMKRWRDFEREKHRFAYSAAGPTPSTYAVSTIGGSGQLKSYTPAVYANMASQTQVGPAQPPTARWLNTHGDPSLPEPPALVPPQHPGSPLSIVSDMPQQRPDNAF